MHSRGVSDILLFILSSTFLISRTIQSQDLSTTFCNGTQDYQIDDSMARGGLVKVEGYANNSVCTWNITVPYPKVVLLRFNWIDLPEYKSGCIMDKISMYGDNLTDLFIVCGTWKPSFSYTSGSSTFLLRLESDDKVTGKGVEFVWSSANYEDVLCKGLTELTESQGTFSSSFNGVQSYANSANCSWRIIAPAGQVISLEFTDFYLICDKDHVGVYDGWSDSAPLLASPGLPDCVGQASLSFSSTGNALFVSFVSGPKGTFDGFRAEYKVIQPDPGAKVVNWTPSSYTGDLSECPSGFAGPKCDKELSSPVQSLRILSISSNSIELKFIIEQQGDNHQFTLEYRMESTGQFQQGNNMEASKPNMTEYVVTQAGLSSDTDYEVRVVPWRKTDTLEVVKGIPSGLLLFRTTKPEVVMPLWMVGAVLGAAGFIVFSLLIAMMVTCCLCRRRSDKNGKNASGAIAGDVWYESRAKNGDLALHNNLYMSEDIEVPRDTYGVNLKHTMGVI